MGQCKRCGKRQWLRKFPERLDIPELRAMVSHWPWHKVEVCPACRPAFDEEFRQRILLLAADVAAQDGDVSERVCLLCGNQEPDAVYLPSARWVDNDGAPLATLFSVCDRCRGKILINNIVSTAELREIADFKILLTALPEVTEDLVRRTEGWMLSAGLGPQGATEVRRGLALDEAAGSVLEFWTNPPVELEEAEGTRIRGASVAPPEKNAIRTHLRLEWRTGMTDTPEVVALAVYRGNNTFTLTRHSARKV